MSAPSLRRFTIAPVAALALLAVSLLVAPVRTQAASGSTVTIVPPAPNMTLKPGPNVEKAQQCLTCHSTDYIYSQPPLTKAQWTAEVNKMRNAYAAPIPEADVAPIVEYLMSQNGKT